MAYVPTVQLEQYEQQLEDKVSSVRKRFDGWPVPEVQVFSSPPQYYRCRCEFAIWHEGEATNYVMFEARAGQEQPQRRVVHEYPIALRLINRMMPAVLEAVHEHTMLRRKLFQVNFHCTRSGQAVVTMVYHKKLNDMAEEWKGAAAKLRARLAALPGASDVHLVGRSRKAKVLLDRDYVVETQHVHGRTYTQKQPEGAFSQPNGAMCEHMVAWATEAVRDSPGDCLELYCGNGNFTVPMSQHFRQVVATEVSKSSVAAARDNIEANGIENIFVARMSSEEFVEAWRNKTPKNRLKGLDWDTLDFRTLVVDPPRCGLDKDTEKLMAGFERVVYVSCNPETLRANLECMRESHAIRKFAVFDQFPFTHHIECGVYLEMRDAGADVP